ncbi:nuclease EXOG, mitochondrial isoform X2 [Tachysurus fulvidraco]|uniref:nuclease EXOG, mitochondrial isoform X2 n=1 Tax=Tachysurus fulvidraco TaxID=1234273 RepID=UPI001FED9673|nr:nuclease EXOG, mitochondrial isoform X2 [Tachysurus fulvidraco]
MASGFKFVRFFGGFVFGATVSTGACVVAVNLYLHPEESTQKKESSTQRLIKLYGLPVDGGDTRYYTNHILSYDQSRRTPRWVAEHLSEEKLLGKADRKHCKFKPDPDIPELFTAHNEDYLGSGWSRGHMAPAGDNKFSENYKNNAGFWNRLEMYCRELTERFRDVWVISGPLTLPQTREDTKKIVSYQLIGKDDVAVPTHLYKVILVRKEHSSDVLGLGAFVVPNAPIGFDHQLKEFQVSLTELERMSGLTFFPQLDKSQSVQNLCLLDSCELMDFNRFTLYITGRKVKGVKSLAKLEKIMVELKEAGIAPDEYLTKVYFEKKQELLEKESPQGKGG